MQGLEVTGDKAGRIPFVFFLQYKLSISGLLLELNKHLIPKLWRYYFRFLFMLINPICLSYICRIQKIFYLEVRHFRSIIKRKNENLISLHVEIMCIK